MSEVSEVDPLQLLDATFYQDTQSELFEDVAEYQKILDEAQDNFDFSREEMGLLIKSLDDRLSYMGKRVHLTGRMLTWDKRESGSDDYAEYGIQNVYVEDRAVESLGFTILQCESAFDPTGQRRLLGLNFNLGHETMQNKALYQTYLMKRGFCLPGEVEVVSAERSLSELSDQVYYFYPDTAAELDSAMLNSKDESEAVMALADVSHLVGQHDTKEALLALVQYVNALVQFDTKVPYQMEFEGLCYQVVPHIPGKILHAMASAGTALAYPIEIMKLEQPYIGHDITAVGRRVVNFGLRIELLDTTDKDFDKGLEYIIPITDSFRMQDLRTQVSIGKLAADNV